MTNVPAPEETSFALSACIAACAILAVSIYSYFKMASNSSARKPVKSQIDVDKQSVIIDAKQGHRASWMAKPPGYFQIGDSDTSDCPVVYNALIRGERLSGNGPCLGTRTGPSKQYTWLTYQQVINKVHQFGSGLIHMGCSPSNDTFIGIYSKNRAEWAIADYGCQAYSMVPIPVYDSFGMSACTYILNHCGIKVVVAETSEKVQKLLTMKDHAPELSCIVAIETVPSDVKQAAKEKNIEFIQFSDLLVLGQKNRRNPVLPKPSDLFSICPTSGTTGDPKGAMVTQENIMFGIRSLNLHLSECMSIGPGDYYLSYLPLAHNFERGMHVMMLMQGVAIGYFSGDVKLLMDDMATLQPTIIISVPRVLTRIYDSVQTQVKTSVLKSKMMGWAMASKMKDIKKSVMRKGTVWDKMVFKKIQNRLGGRIRLIITGSAPLSGEVLTFLRCALSCHVLEGYGQTESSFGISGNLMGDPSVGNVGPPLPGIHVKLADVPDMQYYVKDNVGEICVKGKIVFKGYYNNQEKTTEALDREGWLHTGDIGTWLPNGTLKIIDRKKNIFKLSQGEYIAPDKIETVYKGCQFVGQCYVDGSSLKSCIMGVVVPDPEFIAVWGKNHRFPSTLPEFCKKKESKDLVLKEMREHGKKAGLSSLEQVRDIVLEPNMFSIENDLLTPTLKNKRAVLKKTYCQAINDLYASHGM